MTAAFITLGCKVNQYETQEIRDMLAKSGFTAAPDGDEADVYIINSCTVTAESTSKTAQAVRHTRREHPGSVIVLTGCLPQAFPDEAAKITQADIIVGNRSDSKIAELVTRFIADRQRILLNTEHEKGEKFSGSVVEKMEGHTRAFIKIQDGCDRFCTYCVIPYARGRQRSKPLADLRVELEALAGEDYKEVVLTGINLTSYGSEEGIDLADAAAAAGEAGIKRVRFGSLEPDALTDAELQKLSVLPGFCPQFHLAAQSGSDSVLRRMNRRYTTEYYLALAAKIRGIFPSASLTTDIIVGFPGETDEEFAETLEFVRNADLLKVHVFPYSRRDGTIAASLPDQVTKAVKTKRAAQLSELSGKIREKHMAALNGSVQSVLFETPHEGFCEGYTMNYTPIKVPAAPDLQGQIKDVCITGHCGAEYCTGELID